MAKTGRKRKYKTVEQMQTAIDKYFDETTKITICGLALHLGFAQRKSLLDYEGYTDEPEFCNTIKRAKSRVEVYYEEHLVENNAAGSIFALKNFNWRDKTDIVLEDQRMSKEEIEQVRDHLKAQFAQ